MWRTLFGIFGCDFNLDHCSSPLVGRADARRFCLRKPRSPSSLLPQDRVYLPEQGRPHAFEPRIARQAFGVEENLRDSSRTFRMAWV